MDLHSVFVDLTKVFDTVNREALWTILVKLGCPFKFNMTGQGLCNGDCNNSFNVSNGVKQGCVLVPVLFFSQVLLHKVKDLDLGVYGIYRSDCSVFGLRRQSTQNKTLENLQFKPYLWMTVTSRHTGKITCRPLSTALQRHQGSLD